MDISQEIKDAATFELENNWLNERGLHLRESQESQLPILEMYWQSILDDAQPDVNYRRINPKSRAVDSSQNRSAWSAAFICFVMRKSGVSINDGFEYSRRHITYIVKSVFNRLSGDNGNFQFYGKNDFEDTDRDLYESISIGDLLCLNRKRKNGSLTNHTFRSLSASSDLENIRDVSHCDVVVRKEVVNGKNTITTIGGNVNNSVREKNFEVDSGDMFLMRNNRRRPSRYFGLILINPLTH